MGDSYTDFQKNARNLAFYMKSPVKFTMFFILYKSPLPSIKKIISKVTKIKYLKNHEL